MSRGQQIKLPYGLCGDKIIHITEAMQGLACRCVCPACKHPLIARKGPAKAHHFAHASREQCAVAVETALHLACKSILSHHGEIVLPAATFGFSTHRPDFVVTPESRYVFSDIRLECRINDIVPDLLAYVGDRPLLIEIFVTHAVDAIKLDKIKRLRISAIEIDLSVAPRDFAPDTLADLLIHQTANKKWLYNAKCDRYKRLLLASGERKPIVNRGLARHVDFCPVAARQWRGKPYANVIDDCVNCPYSLALNGWTDVACGGRLKIDCFEQLQKYEQGLQSQPLIT